MSSPERVLVVDYDCITCAGTDLQGTWATLATGGSGLGPIDRYDPDAQTLRGVRDIRYGGQLPLTFAELAGSEARARKWPEPGIHAVSAACQKVFDRLELDLADHDPQRMALLGGTALCAQWSQDALHASQKADTRFIIQQCHNIPLSVAAKDLGLQGPSLNIGSACASGGHAALIAQSMIRSGMLDCAFVVGFEFPIIPCSAGGFTWVSALYRRTDAEDRAYEDPAQASRPFSVDRRGFVLAEAVGAVFLASETAARKHGWPVRAELLGGYANSDAEHLTRMSPDNVGRCMNGALAATGLTPDDIDCVNAHATSTPIGDGAELTALGAVFGDRLPRLPVVANKSQLGHSLGASPVLELLLAVEGMNRGILLPTLNHVPDPALPEALIRGEPVEAPHATTLLNSFGFGGTNVCLVARLAS